MRSSSALAPTGTSVSTLCASSQNSPAGNTVLYHLRTKFEPERLERVANTLLRKDPMNFSRTGGGLRRPPPAALLR